MCRLSVFRGLIKARPMMVLRRSMQSLSKEDLRTLSARLEKDHQDLVHMEADLMGYQWTYWGYWALCAPLLIGVATGVLNQEYKLAQAESRSGWAPCHGNVHPFEEMVTSDREDPPQQLRKPVAAIRDATAALEINPHCADALRARGKANILLGNWGQAVGDLHKASRLYYEEEVLSIASSVDFKALNAREQLRMADWVRNESKIKRTECEKLYREVEAMEKRKAKDSLDSSGGFSALLRVIEDPDLMKKLKDSEVTAALPCL